MILLQVKLKMWDMNEERDGRWICIEVILSLENIFPKTFSFYLWLVNRCHHSPSYKKSESYKSSS